MYVLFQIVSKHQIEDIRRISEQEEEEEYKTTLSVVSNIKAERIKNLQSTLTDEQREEERR